MSDDKDQDIDVIRRDIEDTRQRISSEIDAIEGKLTPDHARHVMKERAMVTRDKVADRIGGTAAIVKSNAVRVGTDFGATVRANPIPLAMIGVGTGWLVWQTFKPAGRDVEVDVEPLFELDADVQEVESAEADYAAGVTGSVPAGMIEERVEIRSIGRPTNGHGARSAKERAREASERAKDKAREMKGRASSLASEARGRASQISSDARSRASEVTQRSKERSRELALRSKERGKMVANRSKERAMQARDAGTEAFDANPIAFGALALLAGIGLGLVLPHTRREDRMLGEQREKVVRRARRMADEARHIAVDSIKEGARAAKNTAKQEAEERHLVGRGGETP